jgi:LysR family transcriptional regulator, transcriptional activator of the cysJI operon
VPTLEALTTVDPKLFPAFVAAAELLNFTQAAKRAHMTQSGVSQHVAKLEEQLEVQLFKRVARHVILTEAGAALLRYIREQHSIWSEFVESLRSEETALSGEVAYAMPPSCLMSPHFGMLLERRSSQRNIRLHVQIRSSPEVVDLILRNEVHFGFVTQRPEHPSLEFEHFCDEEYILLSSDPKAMRTMAPEDLFRLQTVDYPGSDVYYNAWIRHHLPDETRDYYSLVHSGRINAIDGAVTMVMGGLGCGVFPRHCVEHHLQAGTLHEYKSKKPPLTNGIYVAQIKDSIPIRRVRQVISWFREMK